MRAGRHGSDMGRGPVASCADCCAYCMDPIILSFRGSLLELLEINLEEEPAFLGDLVRIHFHKLVDLPEHSGPLL